MHAIHTHCAHDMHIASPPGLTRWRQVATAAAVEAKPESAEEYVENLRRKHRSERHQAALEDTNLTDMRFNLLDLRPADMPEVVEALQKNSVVTCLDLSTNDKLDDNALQPLLLALANRSAPTLRRLKLQGTSASIISKNMAKGLKLMRKDLEVEFD